jgi:putative SOS response-associated peptidase YedK
MRGKGTTRRDPLARTAFPEMGGVLPKRAGVYLNRPVVASCSRIRQSAVMCGRFNVIDNPGLRQLLQDLGVDIGLPTRVNVAPTEAVGLVRTGDSGVRLDQARWWLTPSWAPAVDQKYSMFNARSETLATSRAFRTPFKRQRGVVPISSFIEWRTEDGVKQPWLITTESGALAVAALWDVWDRDGSELLSCTLVTTAAAPAFSPWHARMPVVLSESEWSAWLDNDRLIDADDPIFRNELKISWLLQALPRTISNARNKNPSEMEGSGEVVTLLP